MKLSLNFKSVKMLVICLTILLVASCKSNLESELDSMVEPVYIASIGSGGDVLLRDSVGNVLMLNSSYYMAQSIVGGHLKSGDILIPKSTVN